MHFPSFKRSALITISALALAGASLAPGAAFAEPKQGGGGGRGCPVEDEHGNVTYVAVGTIAGLWHCGSDGEWHWGWFTTDLVSGGTSTSTGNIGSTTGTLSKAP
jgi:hypothetical protein